jgi:hypothetical protein
MEHNERELKERNTPLPPQKKKLGEEPLLPRMAGWLVKEDDTLALMTFAQHQIRSETYDSCFFLPPEPPKKRERLSLSLSPVL